MTGVLDVTEVASGAEWTPGGEFTVGAEDELLLVDARGELLGRAGSAVVADLRAELLSGDSVQTEIFADEIEFGAAVCARAEDVARSLSCLRAEAARRAHLMAVGVHPSAPFGAAPLTQSARYDRIAAEFGGLLRTPTAAFQVHVGLPDPESAILAFRALRNRLPMLRGLAAGSPFWHGVDSGLACARSAILRSYPRTYLPPVVTSWDGYVDLIEEAVRAAGMPDYTYVSWDLRLQPRLGTIEVRVMDAQHSLARIAGLTALIQGMARYAVEEPDGWDLSEQVLRANDFAACRDGIEADLIGRDGTRRSLRDQAAEALAEARSVLAADGVAGPLEAIESLLVEQPEHLRQRALVDQHGMRALLRDLAHRTVECGL